MEEVIAKKANFLPVYIVFAIMSIALIALGVFLTVLDNIFIKMLYIVLGVICLGIVIFGLVKYLKQPKYFIIYRDGKLNFADGTSCRPDEVENITVVISRGRRMPNISSLKFTVGGKEYKYTYVQKAEAAERRLNELKNYARNTV